MTDDITLLPCPCCGAPAVTGADAEYENSNGEPAVECSSCNVMSWTVEDWNRRAAVEADRQGRMPSDEEIEEFCAAYADEMGCIHDDTHVDLIRAALSRYSNGQPTVSACPNCNGSGESTRLVGGGPDAHDEACLCPACGGTGDGQPAASAEPNTHTDDDAVDHFAAAMKDKLAQARAKGRYGWREIDPSDLSMMLRSHVDKGDPRDVANFCMFLWSLGKPISAGSVEHGLDTPVAQGADHA